jgi:hypothetical protein
VRVGLQYTQDEPIGAIGVRLDPHRTRPSSESGLDRGLLIQRVGVRLSSA